MYTYTEWLRKTDTNTLLLPEDSIKLTDAQERVIQLTLAGENVCMLGPGGTGKSFLIRRMAEMLRKRYRSSASATSTANQVAVTAMTGIAAELIRGSTLHSWGVIQSQNLGRLRVKGLKPIMNTRCLIVDEISMLDASFLEDLDTNIRRIRGVNKPFGGIQVIFSGDFFQLPPVEGQAVFVSEPELQYVPPLLRFAFESRVFKELFGDNIIQLDSIHRQKDFSFQQLLNKIRVNESLNKEELGLLTEDRISNELTPPLQIFATNREVHQYNHTAFQALGNKGIICQAVDWLNPSYTQAQYHFYREFVTTIPTELQLKVGMPVMSTINVPRKPIKNGSRGVIVDIQVGKAGPLVVVQFPIGSTYIEHRFSMHKFQLSMNRVTGAMDVRDATFADEEGYRIPYSMMGSGEVVLLGYRMQFPLRPVWASTVHKVQGQTLDSAHVDLQYVFTEHQTYVALSRCKALERLVVKNFTTDKIRVHPSVVNFSQRLRL